MLGNSGDDLTNMWGLIATGFAVAGIGLAMQSKAWRRAYFISAFVFVASGLSWSLIRQAAPALTPVLTALTRSPSNWFVLLMLVIVALAAHQYRREIIQQQSNNFANKEEVEQSYSNLTQLIDSRTQGINNGMSALWDKVNALNAVDSNTKPAEEKPLLWMRFGGALNALNPTLNREFLRSQSEFDRATHDANGALNALSQIKSEQRAKGVQFTMTPEQEQATARWNEAFASRGVAEQRVGNLRRTSLEALRNALEQGELIAQGFMRDSDPADPPLTIPREQWRFLSLNPINAEEASGNGIEYFALRFAKPGS